MSADPPKLTQHPKDQSVAIGANVAFHVEATGDKLHFQWQKDRNDLCDGGRYCDTKTDTLHIVDVEEGDKGRYRCIVKNDTERKPSNEARLTIISTLVINMVRICYCWSIDEIILCIFKFSQMAIYTYVANRSFISIMPRLSESCCTMPQA